MSKNAISLITGMLQRKPTERLGCLAGGYRDIKNHPWMQEVNFVKLVKKQIKVRIAFPVLCASSCTYRESGFSNSFSLLLQAPWTPKIDDPLDISNFDNFDDDDGFSRGKKPLTAEEQLVFQDF